MKIFFVGEEIPCEGYSGSNITGLALIDQLIAQGNVVTAFVDPPDYEDEKIGVQQLRTLESRGVETVSLRSARQAALERGQSRIGASISDFFPSVAHAPAIRETLERYVAERKPDILLPFGIAAITWCAGIPGVPQFGPICENIYKVVRARWRYNVGGIRRNWASLLLVLKAWRTFRKSALLLGQLEGSGQFCKDYLEDFKKHGAPHCKLYHMPVIDEAGQRWRQLKDEAQESVGDRIILVGATSTFTLMHLNALLEILPRFARRKREGAEIHLIGDIHIPPELSDILTYPFVKLRGYVDDFGQELRAAKVLLVPTPVPTGSRSRIIKGLSFGCCVVTTVQEQETTPGLVDGETALIADGPDALLASIERALEDDGLRRRIESGGRRCYEERFAPEKSVGEMATDMEKIVRAYQDNDR